MDLGELRPDWVRVEVYADPLDGESPFVAEMTRVAAPACLQVAHLCRRYSGFAPGVGLHAANCSLACGNQHSA